MKAPYKKAYLALKALGVPLYLRDDTPAGFVISGEDPTSYLWADYYSTREDFDFGVNPRLDAELRRFGLACEWMNPGELHIYQR